VNEIQKRTTMRQSCSPDRPESEQRAYFHAALERAIAAESKAGTVERFFTLAGSVLNLKFAGDSLAGAFTPALAHLEIAPTAYPDAVFHIWDSESTGMEMVAPPTSRGCFTSRGDIWTMGSERYKSAYIWSEYALSLFDTVTATGVHWTPAATTLPYWAMASPLRCLFHWWAETKECQLVHAAAVGFGGGSLLITGKGGLGKSTAALSCLCNGLDYIGDDYVLVQLGPIPTVHSLYCTAKLNHDQMARFAKLADLAAEHGAANEKAVMYLYPRLQRQMTRSLPLKAIATPRISNRPRTESAAISAIAIREAATFTTMAQLPRASQHTYHFISRLSAALPASELVLGTNLDEISGAIVRLLTSAESTTESAAQPTIDVPLISVIIAVRNACQFLPQAVASVLAQNYPAVEIIVVHDGSTEIGDDVLCQLTKDVRLLKCYDERRAAVLNRGIREASGKLITFLEADSIWPECTLEILLDGLSDDESCDVVQGFGHKRITNEQASFNGDSAVAPSHGMTVAIYRRESFQKVGLFDQEIGPGEDGHWYNRARALGLKVRQIDGVTLMQRQRAETPGGVIKQDLTALRMFKSALDQERTRAL
jgi:hypothetical protein